MGLWFVLVSLFSMAHANPIDLRLQQYIKDFDLKPLQTPTQQIELKRHLGRMFFFEKELSGNKNISCAECHHPSVNTHDGLPLALGEGARGLESGSGRSQQQGKLLARNTPALFNLNPELPFMFWDGRVSKNANGHFTAPVVLDPAIEKVLTSTVAVQALFPMVDHAEMRGEVGTNEIADAADEHEAWALLVDRILAIPNYRDTLKKIYPGETINIGHIAELIAGFEIDAFAFNDTAYDRYLKGDMTALTETQKLGMDVFFGKGKCGECHRGEQLAAAEFHNVGVPQIGPGKIAGEDFGRFSVMGAPENLYAFRVPPLRNVSLTAPYMHNGSFKTIAQVIEHYDDVEASLIEYKLVNNWKNYIDKIADHDHTSDTYRINHLSNKLTRKLNFEEVEEKALAEFIRGGLTDIRFLNREITEDYKTYSRFQLNTSGFEKLLKAYETNFVARQETYYYFDLMLHGGFALRELEQPIRLIVVQNPEKSQLIYRRQFHKQGQSLNSIVSDVAFNKTETATLDPSVAFDLTSNYNDMFDRIYTYITPAGEREIPVTELSIIKQEVETINHSFHQIPFAGLTEVSDQLNIPLEDLFIVPTSLNKKSTYTMDLPFQNSSVNVILQSSEIRTEQGGIVTTWAIEFESDKVLKKDLASFTKVVYDYLANAGVSTVDVGGHSPSPSKTTEKILNILFP
ncbi:MAG: hypothetical protein K2P81_10110 [Bacteriovoracaceae bacterium]|nr:hypothetical protein [Bacteriovoracaceae bacterium]